jgi:hypothetical protein
MPARPDAPNVGLDLRRCSLPRSLALSSSSVGPRPTPRAARSVPASPRQAKRPTGHNHALLVRRSRPFQAPRKATARGGRRPVVVHGRHRAKAISCHLEVSMMSLQDSSGQRFESADEVQPGRTDRSPPVERSPVPRLTPASAPRRVQTAPTADGMRTLRRRCPFSDSRPLGRDAGPHG